MAGPNRDKETILHAELDLSLIAHFKYVSDAAGHYARPDVLQLLVNFEPQRNMTSLAPAEASSEHGQLSTPGEQRSEIDPSTLKDLTEAKEPQVLAGRHLTSASNP